MEFKLHAPFQATGDQPEAIAALAHGVELGLDEQVLLGVTGSGKTFTMASVIEKVQRPTLVLAHNKTLAAQLCAEFKEFFPENAVEYFVSYYDYYQPEAYIPHTDTYIAKDASTNEEIDRLRLSATCALLERRDVIVVSSVSCIYGLGEPDDFAKLMISLRPGQTMERDELLRRLVEDRYERNDVAFERNRFRVRGDAVDIYPAYWRDRAVRVEFFGDEIDAIREFQPVTGVVTKTLQHTVIYPASHYVTTKDKMERAIEEIERELEAREKFFTDNGQAVEAQRIHQRTRNDIEMMRELATARARTRWCSTASACPARMTTARSGLRNLNSVCISASTSPRRRATMSASARGRSWSRSSARRVCSIRAWRCGPSRGRSTTLWARSTPAPRETRTVWSFSTPTR